MKKLTAALFLIFVCSQMFLWQTASAQISPAIQSLIDDSRASNAFWAVQVRDDDGSVLENLNGDKLIRPASNLKLVSSGLFLNRLGQDFRFETNLYGRGEQQDSVWVGDLIVEGSGDPSIGGELYDDPLFLFEKWYQVLDSLGIKKINGNIVGYDGLFDDVPYPRGWEWDDLTYYYAPEISALSFNSNVVELEVLANGSVGETPEIHWFPFNTPYVEFINEQTITPRGSRFDESYRRVLGSNVIILRSSLPQGYYETEPLSVMEPTLYFVDTFARYIERRGIEFNGRKLSDSNFYTWNPDRLTLLDTHFSKPLSEMVIRLNRESDNFFTEMLLKKVASKEYNVQGSTELGLMIMKDFMHEMEFDTLSVSLRDASGMAPATLIKASELNNFLLKVKQQDYFDVFYESLSQAGSNGTLGHRFRNSSVKDNFFGKSGFVSGVRSISGYLNTDSGKELAVTITTNNYTARTGHVDYIHQRILEYIQSAY